MLYFYTKNQVHKYIERDLILQEHLVFSSNSKAGAFKEGKPPARNNTNKHYNPSPSSLTLKSNKKSPPTGFPRIMQGKYTFTGYRLSS